MYTLLQQQVGLWNGYLYKNNSIYSPLATTNLPGLTIMSFDGPDLYIPGTDMAISGNAVYWRNGIPVKLSNNGNPASAYEVCVDGSDIYVAGRAIIGRVNTYLATWWKNGTPTYLTDTNSYSSAEYISASNGNIYLAGYTIPGNQFHTSDAVSAVVWKNGVATNLTPPGYADRIYGFAVHGSDVYVSVYSHVLGNTNQISRYYKNGTVVNYTGTTGGLGTHIFVRSR
jgi:hypothetical protein